MTSLSQAEAMTQPRPNPLVRIGSRTREAEPPNPRGSARRKAARSRGDRSRERRRRRTMLRRGSDHSPRHRPEVVRRQDSEPAARSRSRPRFERKVKIEGLEEFFGRIEIPVEEIDREEEGQSQGQGQEDRRSGHRYQEKNVIKKRKKYPGLSLRRGRVQRPHPVPVPRDAAASATSSGRRLTRAPDADARARGAVDAHGCRRKGGPEGRQGEGQARLREGRQGQDSRRCLRQHGRRGEARSPRRRTPSETPKVKVEVTIFGRPVEVELDYWQVDKV